MKLVGILFIFVLAVGAVLRLVWCSDMEYKRDEQYTFERVQNAGNKEALPIFGMYSSNGYRNAGLSVWAFLLPARILGIRTPIGLARFVQVTNIAALAGLALFILTATIGTVRAAWLWGIALAAVNPFAIVLSRKIWAQDILAIVSVTIFISWWKRDTCWGAFAWGFTGILAGQIHMTGFLFAPALLGMTAALPLLARRGIVTSPQPVAWKYWLAGNIVGFLPMLPWVAYVAFVFLIIRDGRGHGLFNAARIMKLPFWQHLVSNTLGLRFYELLGPKSYGEWLSYPGVAAAHVVLKVCLVVLAIWAIYWVGRRLMRGRAKLPLQLGNTDLLLVCCLLYGGIFTVFGMSVAWHYLAILFVLPSVLLARFLLATTRLAIPALTLLLITHLLLSTTFLYYIHTHGGAPDGDYGVAYRWQAHS